MVKPKLKGWKEQVDASECRSYFVALSDSCPTQSRTSTCSFNGIHDINTKSHLNEHNTERKNEQNSTYRMNVIQNILPTTDNDGEPVGFLICNKRSSLRSSNYSEGKSLRYHCERDKNIAENDYYSAPRTRNVCVHFAHVIVTSIFFCFLFQPEYAQQEQLCRTNTLNALDFRNEKT